MSVTSSEIKLATIGLSTLTIQEFNWIRDYLYQHAGIVLNNSKQALVAGRLDKRLRYLGITSYSEYFALFDTIGFEQETSMAIDLLTTNETYFFREPKHFEFLVKEFFPKQGSTSAFRIWSAASSSGEEAYTLAMLSAEYAKSQRWEIIGTDLSSIVLEKARNALYPMSAAEKIPEHLLKKYCLKGNQEFEGFFLIDSFLRMKIKFIQANLIDTLPDLGQFDVIFLRNVMIYFDMPTKQKLINNIQEYLKPGGIFIISHSESLNSLKNNLKLVSSSIYRKPA